MYDMTFPLRLDRGSSATGYAGVVPTTLLSEHAALVALLRERPGGRGWTELSGLLLESGSAIAVREDLADKGLFDDPASEEALAIAQADLAAWQKEGFTFLGILDDAYPARVRDVHEAPPFLFARGVVRQDDTGVSVVGSRGASPRGIDMASSIAGAMTAKGLTVISGLAAGIDTAAHTAALDAGGRTVAVIGTGIRQSYPAANRSLQQCVASRGLLLSQFWPDAPPQAKNFPMRNAVMSGYGLATIVVEAGEQSGARIQARLAVKHGRPVILTDLVVSRTDWGKSLTKQPDVWVASSLDDVSQIVDRLLARPHEVSRALAELAV